MRSPSSRKRWLIYAACAIILALALAFVALLTNPRTSAIIPAATATAAPPTIVAMQPTPPPPPPNTNTAAPVLSTPTLLPSLTSTPLPTSWEYDWLRGIPCRAPCWEGITPGKTTADDAIKILSGLPFVDKTSLPSIPLGMYTDLQWTWVGTNKGGRINVFFPQANPTLPHVDRIAFQSSYTLGNIIQAYGQPSHIVVRSYPPYDNIGTPNATPTGKQYYTAVFYWLSLGIVIYASDYLEKPGISPDVKINAVELQIPVEKPDDLQYIGKLLVSWQGFNDFDFYCQQMNSHTGCIVPYM